MTADGPLVSVIISTWNRAGWLDDCLASLAAQKTADPFEVVVVDNASTDVTHEVIEKWCSKDPRFRGVHENRLGLSVGKNTGAKEARGSLLLFTDDDVVASEEWVRAYRDFFAALDDGVLVAGGHIQPVRADLRPWEGWFRDEYLDDVHQLHHGREGRLGPGSYVWGGNFAVTAKVFAALGCFEEDLGLRGDNRGTFEDTEFQDRVRANGGSVWFVPGARVHHRVRSAWVTPRAILSVAFTRGRNAFWQSGGPASGRKGRGPAPRIASDVCALGGLWLLWVIGCLAYRMTGNATALAVAHRAAYRYGGSMERTCSGRSSAAVRYLERIVYRARSLALRAAPDKA